MTPPTTDPTPDREPRRESLGDRLKSPLTQMSHRFVRGSSPEDIDLATQVDELNRIETRQIQGVRLNTDGVFSHDSVDLALQLPGYTLQLFEARRVSGNSVGAQELVGASLGQVAIQDGTAKFPLLVEGKLQWEITSSRIYLSTVPPDSP